MKKVYVYPSCISVQGYSRGIIQDLYRSKYIFAPKWLIHLLYNNNTTIHELRSAVNEYDKESQLEDYLNFLIENEIVYITDKDIRFQETPLVFDTPSIITNSILLFKDINLEKLKKLILELEDLGCENVQLYFPEFKDLKTISNILLLFDNSIVQYIELITNYNINYSNFEKLAELFSNNNRLFKLHLANAPESKKIFVDVFHIKYVAFSIDEFNFTQCGEIHPLYFKNNLSFFTESQKHNICLNRKICIDENGEIKNCPVMTKSYGNVENMKLEDVIKNKDFQTLWHINKEKVDVCKDCEFRHLCTDCRCFIKDPDNIYSQPTNCRYNPYICKWEGEDGYKSVEECGIYTKISGFIPDHEKIKNINNKLWGD